MGEPSKLEFRMDRTPVISNSCQLKRLNISVMNLPSSCQEPSKPGCFYIPEVSLNEMREQVKVGDTVRVWFEVFGMPDKHVPGRVVHPKRVYKSVLVKERRGNHLKGEVYGEGEVRFNVEQIIQVYESE